MLDVQFELAEQSLSISFDLDQMTDDRLQLQRTLLELDRLEGRLQIGVQFLVFALVDQLVGAEDLNQVSALFQFILLISFFVILFAILFAFLFAIL